MILIDLINNRYGKLTVMGMSTKRGPKNQIFWTCKCDCGGETDIVGFALRGNKRVSCGQCARISCNKIKNRDEAIARKLYRFTINRDKQYGGKCDLSFEDFFELINGVCFYCKLENSNKTFDSYNREYFLYTNGLDRLDSKKGYIKGNVVSCCKYCNRAKNNMSIVEYKDFIKRVSENFL